MSRALPALALTLLLAGCESKQEPVPPPRTPEKSEGEKFANVDGSRPMDDAFEELDSERFAEILDAAREGLETDAQGGGTSGRAELLEYESIPHPGYRGPVGPHDDAAVLFTDDGEGGPDSVFIHLARETESGWTVEPVASAGGPWRVLALEDVFFADAGSDGDVDLFVVGRFTTGIGSAAGKRFTATIPYVWSEGAFQYPNRLDDPLSDAESTERALKILRREDVVESD